MDSYSRLESLIKNIVKDLLNVMKLSDIVYGKVTSENPLVINVDQKLNLNKNQLILTRGVTDYYTDLTIEGGSKRNYKVHNSLKTGETVILLRLQGGQQFLVLDRVGDV